MDEKKIEAIEKLRQLVGSSASKVTTADVLQGLTSGYHQTMISSIPRPDLIIMAETIVFFLDQFPEYSLEAGVCRKIIETYLMSYAAAKGKNNRANKVLEAAAAVGRAELELEKSKKGMFQK